MNTVNRKELLKVIRELNTHGKSDKRGLLLTVIDNKLYITARGNIWNDKIILTKVIDGFNAGLRSGIIQAVQLQKLLQASKENDIAIADSDIGYEVRAGKASMRIEKEPADLGYYEHRDSNTTRIWLRSSDTQQLIDCLGDISSVAKIDNDNPAYGYAQLETNKGYIGATDNKRLALKYITLYDNLKNSGVIPLPTAYSLGSIIDILQGDKVALSVSQTRYSLESTIGKLSWTCECGLPNLDRCMPKNICSTATIGKNELHEALRVISLGEKGVAIQYQQTDSDMLLLTSMAMDNSMKEMARYEQSCKILGDKLNITLSSDFMLDVLKMTKNTLRLGVVNDRQPAMIETDNDIKYVVMPIAA